MRVRMCVCMYTRMWKQALVHGEGDRQDETQDESEDENMGGDGA